MNVFSGDFGIIICRSNTFLGLNTKKKRQTVTACHLIYFGDLFRISTIATGDIPIPDAIKTSFLL
jgi:hypothetical protein